jgi:hypothetical protein
MANQATNQRRALSLRAATGRGQGRVWRATRHRPGIALPPITVFWPSGWERRVMPTRPTRPPGSLASWIAMTALLEMRRPRSVVMLQYLRSLTAGPPGGRRLQLDDRCRLVDGLMVVGDQRALDRGAELPLEPDPGGQANSRCATRIQTPWMVWAPWRSRPSWSLRVSKMASIHWRTPPRSPNRAGSSARSGRTSRASGSATTCSNARPAKPCRPG